MANPIDMANIDQYFMRLGSHLRSQPMPESIHAAKLAVLQGVGENFRNASGPDGTKWPPRRRVGDGHPLLIDTTLMSQAAIGLGQGKIDVEDFREFTVGVNGSVVPYASKHQNGDPMDNLPQREFMGASDKTLSDIGEMFADDLISVFLED